VQVDRREEATEWFIKAVAADKDNIGIPPRNLTIWCLLLFLDVQLPGTATATTY
jgi:hypothetical protein